MARKGMMVGTGKKGYHNVIGKDPAVHSQSAKGIKQPQQLNIIVPTPPIPKIEPMSEYDIQAEKFLNDTDTKFSTKFFKSEKYFPDDREARDIYKITLENKKGSYTFRFGQSIAYSGSNRKAPTPYDVLASVTKYDPSTFENFCVGHGFDTDSLRDYKTYKATVKEYNNLKRLFSEKQLEEMQEIN